MLANSQHPVPTIDSVLFVLSRWEMVVAADDSIQLQRPIQQEFSRLVSAFACLAGFLPQQNDVTAVDLVQTVLKKLEPSDNQPRLDSESAQNAQVTLSALLQPYVAVIRDSWTVPEISDNVSPIYVACVLCAILISKLEYCQRELFLDPAFGQKVKDFDATAVYPLGLLLTTLKNSPKPPPYSIY